MKNSGYFVALKLTHPEVSSSEIMLNRGIPPFESAEKTRYLGEDGILVYKLAIEDGKADSFTATVVLGDGSREVTTIDLSGLTLGADDSELTVTPADKDYTEWGVKVESLQSNLTVDPAENGVFKVHGTSKYFEDSDNKNWNTGWGDNYEAGYYVAVKLNFPGATADGDIVYYYTAPNGKPDTNSTHDAKDGDVLLWKIKPSTNMKPINNVKLTVQDKDYTIDISDVTLRGTTASISAVTDDTVDLLGKKASDLQSGIAVGDPVGNRIKVTGTSKYVKDYDNYSTGSSKKEGHYIALNLNWPGVANNKVQANWKNSELGPLDSDGIAIIRLENGITDGVMKDFIVKANGIQYILDLSKITREADPESGLVISAPRAGETVSESDKVSEYNVEDVTVSGYTVSGGRLAYQDATDAGDTRKDDHGYYVALYIAKGETGATKIWWREPGTDGAGTEATGSNGIFLLPVKIGNAMFSGSKDPYTSLEIATVAGDAGEDDGTNTTETADWEDAVVVDLSGLTNLGREAEAITIETYGDVGSSNGDKASLYQENVEITGSGTEYTVTGNLNYISSNNQFDRVESSGYYAVIALDTGLGRAKIVSHTYTATEVSGRVKTAPDGESGWKVGEERDGRLELMSLLATERENGRLTKTTYCWFDGIKYTINWDMELAEQPMNPASLG